MCYFKVFSCSVQKLPGVLRYITYKDIPAGGVNNCIPPGLGEPEEVWMKQTCS